MTRDHLSIFTLRKMTLLGYRHSLGCSLVFVIADILSAILLRGIGKKLQMAYGLNARLLGLLKSPRDKGIIFFDSTPFGEKH